MMKKCLSLLVMSAFLCVASYGQWAAYAYKGSIKRLDAQVGTVKYSSDIYDNNANVTDNLDYYSTANDKLTGYLLVPVCSGCAEDGGDSSLPFGQSYLYIIRGNDTTKKVWKFIPEVNSGVFSKGVSYRGDGDELEGKPTSLKKLKQSWMEIVFSFEDMGFNALYNGKYSLPYGFLGYGSSSGTITLSGFGSVVTKSTTTVSGVCDDPVVNSCTMITGITDGHLVGQTEHIGICGLPAIWDVCSLDQIESSVVNGTWSIKLNDKISALVNAQSTLDDIEKIMLEKLGGKSLVASE